MSRCRNVYRRYFLFKGEQLSTDIKLILHEAFIRALKTYACSTWEFAADANFFLNLQHFQNQVVHSTGQFPGRKPVRELDKAFWLSYVYDCIIKMCRYLAEGIQNEDAIVRGMGQGEALRRRYRLGGFRRYLVIDTCVKCQIWRM